MSPSRSPLAPVQMVSQADVSQKQPFSLQSAPAQTQGRSFAHVPLFPSARENKTGLPDSLKAGVEQLSGFSLDDVHVSYHSSRPAHVQAMAYTQGTQIHIAPGQERHLPHEAWHVVQQKQGRVQPTFQAKGLELNNDSQLEHEADVMGEQATRLPAGGVHRVMSARSMGRTGDGLMTGAPAQRRVIQRRVGFEFEAAGGWRFQAKRANQHNPEPIVHTKASILWTPNHLGALSADNGNVEFRTEPLSTLQEVTTTVNQLLAFRTRFQNNETVLTGQERAAALAAINDADHNYQQVSIRAQGNLVARPQATLGIKLSDIPTLLNQLVTIRGTEEEGETEARRTRIAQNYAQFGDEASLDRIVTGGGVTEDASSAVQEANTIYQAAVNAYAQLLNAQPEPQGARNEIVGFLTLLIKLLYDASINSKSNEDMKTAFPLMPRTDLRSAFLSMEVAAQNFMVALWNAGHGPLYTEINNLKVLADPIFPEGYKSDTGHNQGPTKEQLFRSVIEPNQQNNGRDILSPAPGYNRLEGFGSLGVDDQNAKLVLFEFRGIATIGQGSTIGFDKWLSLAETFFRLVDAVTNPPQQQQPQQANNAVQNAPNVPNVPAPVVAQNVPNVVQNPPVIAQQNAPVVQNVPNVVQNAPVVLPPVLPVLAQIIPPPAQNVANDPGQPGTKKQKVNP